MAADVNLYKLMKENHAKSRKLLKIMEKTTTLAVMENNEEIAHNDQENMKIMRNQGNYETEKKPWQMTKTKSVYKNHDISCK